MKTLPRAVNRLHCLVFNTQLNSTCILIFVCSENIATCLRQINNRQAGIVNYIRDSEQAAENQLFKNQRSCFREQNQGLKHSLYQILLLFELQQQRKTPGLLSLNGIVEEIPFKNNSKTEVNVFTYRPICIILTHREKSVTMVILFEMH